MSTIRLRRIADADSDAVLALNQAHVEVLSPLSRERLDALRGWAQRLDVIELDGGEGSGPRVVGFVVVIGPGTAYDSPKYVWFDREYDDFLYLDRIVVDERVHRRGVGTMVYDAVEDDAATHGRLCLEVDVDPPNVASLAFHDARGFTEIARLGAPGDQVSMRVKQLPATTPGG